MDASKITLLVLSIIFTVSLILVHIIKLRTDYLYIKAKYKQTGRFYKYSVPSFIVQLAMATSFIYIALVTYSDSLFMSCTSLILCIMASAAFMLAMHDTVLERNKYLDSPGNKKE